MTSLELWINGSSRAWVIQSGWRGIGTSMEKTR